MAASEEATETGLEDMWRGSDMLDQQLMGTDPREQGTYFGDLTADISTNPADMSIFHGASIPGTLGQDTFQLKTEEAQKLFVKTKTFSHAQRILDQYHHVTICGVSGEGKTTMSLMLARDYIKKGYQAVFVDNIDKFDFSDCISSAARIVLILDDIFGTVGLSTDYMQLRNVLDSVYTHIKNCQHDPDKISREHNKANSFKSTSPRNRGKTHKPDKQQPDKDIRVVFTSKTYNFQEGISHLKYQKFSLFIGQTLIDLAHKEYSYSSETKVAIFERHKTLNPSVSVQDVTKEDILGLDETLFGFPQTCKLFFEFPTFRSNARDFFKHPLFYLKMELSRIMALDNNQTAALILMLLCEDKLDLTQLELQGQNKTMDDRFKLVTDIVPSATRSGIATTARRFRGTYFSGGDMLQFAHSSIYDACACAMYNKNPSFVLKYSSYDFLYERLKSGTTQETGASEYHHFIFLSENYHDQIAARVADGIDRGHFTKTITQPVLKNRCVARLLVQVLDTKRIQNEESLMAKHKKKNIVQVLVQKLRAQKTQMKERDTFWAHMKDKGKCFLYWAAIGGSVKLISEMEVTLNITFTQAEVQEGLIGCAEHDNLEMLQFLLPKYLNEQESVMRNRLLLVGAENASWDVTEHLLNTDCDITHTVQNKQNIFHFLCKKDKASFLKKLLEKQTITSKCQDVQSAINSVDIHGRTPIMLAVQAGSVKCFQLLHTVSDVQRKDRCGDCLIHLACDGGNTEIIQTLLTPSNINRRGRYDRTSIMKAVVTGQKAVFDLLVSHKADLTLVDVYGDSLLHLACQSENTEIVQQLLTPSNINSRGDHGLSPIMVAAYNGHQRLFDLLTSQKADTTLVDDDGDSLLHLACYNGNTEIVRQLLTPSNINSRGQYGYTPVMVAAVEGNQRVFELLVSHKADLTLVDNYGDSPLHLACQGGNTEIVHHLLTSSNINCRGEYGWTPVMNTAYKGHIHVIDLLVENQADLKLVDKWGRDVVSIAQPEVAEYLTTLLKPKHH